MKAKFVERENLHISLKFLGDLNSQEIDKTIIILQQISILYHCFMISLAESIGSFPTFNRPRVIWAGINKGNNIILEIYRTINDNLRKEPFYPKEKESRFSAHITLARVKYVKYPGQLANFTDNIKIKSISQQVKTIDLMESQLTKKGPEYKVIHRFPLLA